MTLPVPSLRSSRVLGPYRFRPIGQTITPVIRDRVVSPDELEAELQASRRDGFRDQLLDVLFPRWP